MGTTDEQQEGKKQKVVSSSRHWSAQRQPQRKLWQHAQNSGWRVFLAVTLVALTTTACSKDPARPRTIPPSQLATPAFWDPVWLPDSLRIGFNHTPLDSISYDPYTGSVYAQWNNSASGWWTDSTGGGSLHRELAIFLSYPAIEVSRQTILFTASSGAGLRLFTAPLQAGLPDPSQISLVATPQPAGAGRWSPGGDSLVYRVPFTTEAWIAAADGSGARLAWPTLEMPDWHPLERRLLGTFRVDSAGPISRLLTLDLDTQTLSSLLVSRTLEYRWPRYSPDGSHIAFIVGPITGGADPHLWIANADGSNAHQLISDPVNEGFAWSGSSQEIAYVRFAVLDWTYSNGTVWTVDIATGVKRLVAGNR
jgi:Tol biopolymer transport system component